MKPNIKLGFIVLFTPFVIGVGILFYINPYKTAVTLGFIFGVLCIIGWIWLIGKLFGIESNDPF